MDRLERVLNFNDQVLLLRLQQVQLIFKAHVDCLLYLFFVKLLWLVEEQDSCLLANLGKVNYRGSQLWVDVHVGEAALHLD